MIYKDHLEPYIPGECFVLDGVKIEDRRELLNPYNAHWNNIAAYMSWSGTLHRVYIVDRAIEQARKSPQ